MERKDQDKIRSFKDLNAWKEAYKLTVLIYKLTKSFPKEEIFGIVNQVRRAAVSITSNIAEGFSRNSNKEKIQFYAMALGSLTEVENQIIISEGIGYLDANNSVKIQEICKIVHKLINGMIKYLKNN